MQRINTEHAINDLRHNYNPTSVNIQVTPGTVLARPAVAQMITQEKNVGHDAARDLVFRMLPPDAQRLRQQASQIDAENYFPRESLEALLAIPENAISSVFNGTDQRFPPV